MQIVYVHPKWKKHNSDILFGLESSANQKHTDTVKFHLQLIFAISTDEWLNYYTSVVFKLQSPSPI